MLVKTKGLESEERITWGYRSDEGEFVMDDTAVIKSSFDSVGSLIQPEMASVYRRYHSEVAWCGHETTRR